MTTLASDDFLEYQRLVRRLRARWFIRLISAVWPF